MGRPKTDAEVRRLWRELARGKSLEDAALASEMSQPTARKFHGSGMMPSEMKKPRDYRTRENPFEDVWSEIVSMLNDAPRLKSTTILQELQEKYPGKFQDGQLRSLQRQMRQWRGSDGPDREIYFPQEHYPGDLGASDFTHMTSLGITIAGQAFPHMLYHFVMTYSNWETASICFSESLESFKDGFQNAVWKLGGVPRRHRTDCLSAAVKNLSPKRDFTARLYGLMQYYNVRPTRTNPSSPHENGDCESLNGHIKDAVDQALMLRGSREFADREAYQQFIEGLLDKKNAGRSKRFAEECEHLGPLPEKRLPSFDTVKIKVRKSSTISVKKNTYSVPSRLIGHEVTVRVYAEYLEVWYADRCTERLPRLHGKKKHRINYRHVIDSLVRKPGAFENYQWHEDLFPTVRFRIAYDELLERCPAKASREYLKILHLAARENESLVDSAIARIIEDEGKISSDAVKALVEKDGPQEDLAITPEIPEPDFGEYNSLFESDLLLDSTEYDEIEGMPNCVREGVTQACSHQADMLIDLNDTEVPNDGEGEQWTTEKRIDGDAARAAFADSSCGVRGDGPAGGEPVAQLRAVSGGTDPSGMRGTSHEPDHATVTPIKNPDGEDAGCVRDKRIAAESEPPGEDAIRRRLPRPR